MPVEQAPALVSASRVSRPRPISQFAGLAAGLRAYLKSPQPSSWHGLIRGQLDSRERNFLATVRQGIFENPRNPYLEMFRLAGCAYADLEQEVRRHGLVRTLEDLRRSGVFLNHDEFKGKQTIVRDGRELAAGAGAFANPTLRGGLVITSGGSRSAGTSSTSGVAHRTQREAYTALHSQELGLEGRRHVNVRPVLPAIVGVADVLHYSRLGQKVDRWFAPGGGSADSVHYRLMTAAMVAIQRWHGLPAPFPSYLPPNDFLPAARHLARRRGEGVSCAVGCYVSHGVRVAAAALEQGLDIEGTMFLVGGEALTGAKRRVMESAGWTVYPRYFITEIGAIGFACRQMRSGNCVHLFGDSVAAIRHSRPAPFSGQTVDSLLFTTLLPCSPHILINAEMGDTAVIEPATCHCTFTGLGFRMQLRDISSYSKLTGQGITLAGADVLRLLEEKLPARFGGSPADYQLVESEGRNQTEIALVVSPRVSCGSEDQIRDFFLSEIRGLYGGALASRVWTHADGFRVTRREPFQTRAGKILPLHLLGGSAGDLP